MAETNGSTTESDPVPHTKVEQAESCVDPATNADSDENIEHPYAEAIARCPCNDWQKEIKDPEPMTTLTETQFTMVDSKELLDQMMTKLKSVKEIAVAIKRYTFRSFNGINCLIQISTRTEDFIVDSVVLKDEVKVLGEVFADPGVVKVMYKAGDEVGGDIEMLQKDLNIFVVNLFDLRVAVSKFKTQPVISNIATLLKDKYEIEICEGDGNSDWHERPLTAEKVKFARQEVHYMLHIHDDYRNSLIEHNLLDEFYVVCNSICSEVWYPGKDGLQPDSHLRFYKKTGKLKLNGIQIEVLRSIYKWRYEIAEKHGEGPSYIIPNGDVLKIAKALPKSIEEIKAGCSSKTLCPLMEENLEELQKRILKAKEEASNLPNALEKVWYLPYRGKDVEWMKEKINACGRCGKPPHRSGVTCPKVMATTQSSSVRGRKQNRTWRIVHPRHPYAPRPRPRPSNYSYGSSRAAWYPRPSNFSYDSRATWFGGRDPTGPRMGPRMGPRFFPGFSSYGQHHGW